MTNLLVSVLLLAAQDPEPESLPKGPPPRLVKITGPESFTVYESVQRPVMLAKAFTVVEGGKAVTKVVNETVMVTEMRAVAMNLKGAKGRTAGGKALDADAVAEAIKKPQVVVVSTDGKPVDPAYLRLMKTDTLILELAPPALTPTIRPRPGIRPLPAEIAPIKD